MSVRKSSGKRKNNNTAPQPKNQTDNSGEAWVVQCLHVLGEALVKCAVTILVPVWALVRYVGYDMWKPDEVKGKARRTR